MNRDKNTFSAIKKFIRIFLRAPEFSFLLKYSYMGMADYQEELARFYFEELEDYVEAYAWAKTAGQDHNQYGYDIKCQAEKKLSSEEIKKAERKTDEYKKIKKSACRNHFM